MAVRAVSFYALRDLIPLYGVYALLFSDSGLGTGEISSLLVIWSLTSFVLEIPSGAWADTVSRRLLLIVSSSIYAVAFAMWMLIPSYPGFAAGFILWGLSSSLMSGTFEALLYDELATHNATAHYAGIVGVAHAAAMGCDLVATVLAAPLYAVGGYQLVGWLSVGIALLQVILAVLLPSAPSVARVDADGIELTDGAPIHDPDAPTEGRGFLARYLLMLKNGLREVAGGRDVRRAVLLTAIVLGLLSYDEYFSLLAREQGASTTEVPLLVAITIIGQMIGTALAGWTEGLSGRQLGWLLGAAATLMAAGPLIAPAVAEAAGFAVLGLGYGIAANIAIVAETRLQDAIAGKARATVISVSGFASEVAAISVFGAIALSSVWFSLTTTAVLVAVPLALAAIVVPRWLPSAPAVGEPPGAVGGSG